MKFYVHPVQRVCGPAHPVLRFVPPATGDKINKVSYLFVEVGMNAR